MVGKRAETPRWAAGVSGILCMLVTWQLYVTAAGIPAFVLPAPARVAAAFGTLVATPTTWTHAWRTVEQTAFGFVLACAAGIAVGLPVSRLRWLENAIRPLVLSSQVMPKLALVPLLVVWFGYGSTSKVLMSALMAFFPVFTNTILGFRSVEAGHEDLLLTLNAGVWQRFVRLDLPSAAPHVLAGMEIGIVLAVTGCTVTQLLGGNEGLGYLLSAKMNAFQTDALFAVVLLLVLISLGFYGLVVALRRLLIPWHHSSGLAER